VLDARVLELGAVVQRVVEAHNGAHAALAEVADGVAERLGDRPAQAAARPPLHRGPQRVCVLAVVGRGEGDEVWREPVPVAVGHLLVELVLVEIEGREVEQLALERARDTVQHVLQREVEVGTAVASVTERLELDLWWEWSVQRLDGGLAAPCMTSSGGACAFATFKLLGLT